MAGQTLKLKNLPPKGPKSICLLRLSAIGDVCHAVAMVQQIQKAWPETQITWIIGKIELQLVKHLPKVNFVVFDKKQGFKAYRELYLKLRHQHFNLLMHMQVALRSSLASLCVNADIKLGFDEKRAKEGQWLFTNAQVEPIENPHVLEGFMGFAKAAGIDADNPSWNIPIPSDDELWASENLDASKPIAVICPAASKAIRNWTTQGYAQTAEYLQSKGFNVYLCGGPAPVEKQLAESILTKSNANITNLVGQTSLLQLLAILKLSQLVIAPDTGPAHMAVTVGTPVIGLYAHSNPGRTGPYLYQDYVVSYYSQAVKLEYNKDVHELPWGIRAKGDSLMQQIGVDQVNSMVDKVISDFYPELSSEEGLLVRSE